MKHKRILILICTFVFLNAAVFLVIAFYVKKEILSRFFHPTKPIVQTPQSLGIDFQNVFIKTSNDCMLHGWYIPLKMKKKGEVVFYIHGNSHNISHRMNEIKLIVQLGYDLLIFDFRGFGKSKCDIEDFSDAYEDTRDAFSHLVSEMGKSPAQIIVYGQSLGASLAVDIAKNHEVKALILSSGWTRAHEFLKPQMPSLFHFCLPDNKLYNILDTLPHIRSPTVIIHSKEDELFPLEMAERNFHQIKGQRKKMIVVTGKHEQGILMESNYQKLYSELKHFLDNL